MARVQGYSVEGLTAVVKALQAAGLDVQDLKGAFSRLAAEGARLAAGYAPRRSGALASSIRGNKAKSKAVVSAGNARRVPYAGPINYGWPSRGIRGREFMQRVDAELGPRAITLLEQDVNRVLREKGLL